MSFDYIAFLREIEARSGAPNTRCLAQVLGVTRNQVSRWRRGENEMDILTFARGLAALPDDRALFWREKRQEAKRAEEERKIAEVLDQIARGKASMTLAE